MTSTCSGSLPRGGVVTSSTPAAAAAKPGHVCAREGGHHELIATVVAPPLSWAGPALADWCRAFLQVCQRETPARPGRRLAGRRIAVISGWGSNPEKPERALRVPLSPSSNAPLFDVKLGNLPIRAQTGANGSEREQTGVNGS